jgi:hypothetical protein
LAALLDWSVLEPVTGPGAPGTPSPPNARSTALELPYRIVLTADGAPVWTRPNEDPAASDPVTELWRTTTKQPQLRVVWSPELLSPPDPGPEDIGRPNAIDRSEIAGQAPQLTNGDLTLSALGASVDLRAVLDDSASLASWRHVMADGRDTYVRLIARGALAPFGHRASVATVIDRVPSFATDGTMVEALRSTSILVVTEPVVDYAGQFPSDDHPPLPFRSVRLTTLVTTAVDTSGDVVETVESANVPFPFHLVATDLPGRRST